jgi:hypothetical protein
VFVRVTDLKASDSKGWIAASILCGPIIWLLWTWRKRRSNKVSERFGIADRVLDVDTDDFGMRCPIDGLDEHPLLSFIEITQASSFVSKFPSLAKFINLSIQAGRKKVLETEAQTYGLNEEDIAMIFLCVMVRAHLLR